MLFVVHITIANREIDRLSSNQSSFKGWGSPVLVASALVSATSHLRHVTSSNSLANTRRSISQHNDLDQSNDIFSLFLDETMAYSCAIFKGQKEPLINAQMRKINQLIN